MKTYIKSMFFRQFLLAFTGMPLFIWAMGNSPERSLLKESLAVITILAFCQMPGQFFWSRCGRSAMTNLKMSSVIKYHKTIGYTFIIILSLHPAYLVIPRCFEAGVSPVDAFVTIVTTLNTGVVLGITAWCLMLILGITSFLRNRLPMKYKTWRIFHGIMAILFITAAAWHTIDLGRHVNFSMSILISIMSAGGILLLLRTYTSKKTKRHK